MCTLIVYPECLCQIMGTLLPLFRIIIVVPFVYLRKESTKCSQYVPFMYLSRRRPFSLPLCTYSKYSVPLGACASQTCTQSDYTNNGYIISPFLYLIIVGPSVYLCKKCKRGAQYVPFMYLSQLRPFLLSSCTYAVPLGACVPQICTHSDCTNNGYTTAPILYLIIAGPFVYLWKRCKKGAHRVPSMYLLRCRPFLLLLCTLW